MSQIELKYDLDSEPITDPDDEHSLLSLQSTMVKKINK